MIELITQKMEMLVKMRAKKQVKAKFENPFANAHMKSHKGLDSIQHLKLRFPKYEESSGVTAWLQDCDQYFEIYKVGESKKVAIAGMHLEGTARKWFQVYTVGRSNWQWEEFCKQITSRFGVWEQELLYDNFKNLRQVTTIDVYYSQFEKYMEQLKEKMPSLTEGFFVESFISGLKSNVGETLKLLNPLTLEQAFRQAKQCTEPKEVVKKVDHSCNSVSSKTGQSIHSGKFSNMQGTPGKAMINREVIKLSPKQLASRIEEGLCLYCNDKDGPTHKCRQPCLFKMTPQEEGASQLVDTLEEPELELDNDTGMHTEEFSEVSVHAIEGSHNNKIITLIGRRGKQQFSILIDGGSTHSFLDEQMASKLRCELVKTHPMKVQVANGNHLVSQFECAGFTWKMGDMEFQTAVRTLPMGSYDLVLGVDWLGALGLVTFDYKNLTLQFKLKDKMVTLQGTSQPVKPRIQQMSAKAFVRSCQRQGNGFLFLVNQVQQPTGTCYSLEEKDAIVKSGVEEQLQQLLQNYEDIFKTPVGLPPHRAIEHSIELKEGAQPFSIRPYRNSYDQKNEIEKLVAEMLEAGIIRPISSPFASPILLVKKKDGTWSFCIDYRKLNSLTMKNKFPILLIDELLDELCGAKFFTKLDLRAGYHQVRMKGKDIEKTAFRTHLGHYEFTVMPFGLTNAPATFQNLMNQVFAPYLRKFTLVFFDDILVYSKDAKEHLQHLEKVFQIMRQHQLYAKQSKCEFLRSQVAYLGHVITHDGVEVDKSKVADMLAWPLPTNIKALRGFLGLSGYYRKFVKDYGRIAKPLTNLLQKDNFQWSEESTEAFNALKQAMSCTPVLRLPDYSQEFTVETDASNSGIGAVLTQQGHPLAFFSKALGPRGQAMSTYEKELMAVVAAVKKWSSYLMDKHFFIKTDHWALKFLTDQKISNLLQQKWISKLLGYNYTIIYRKGTDNKVADALSRMYEESKDLQDSELTKDVPEDMDTVKGEGMLGLEEFSSS